MLLTMLTVTKDEAAMQSRLVAKNEAAMQSRLVAKDEAATGPSIVDAEPSDSPPHPTAGPLGVPLPQKGAVPGAHDSNDTRSWQEEGVAER